MTNQAMAKTLRARLLAARGDLAGAEEEARGALDILGRSDFLEGMADAWLALAEVLGPGGEPEAQAAAARALELYEQKGNRVGAGWARAWLDAEPSKA